MEKEIRLKNKLTTEDIDNKEFIERMEKRFEYKESSITDVEKRELRKQAMKNEVASILL